MSPGIEGESAASEPPERALAGRYRLVAPLGEGSFGEVWDAEDLLLRERVAIKRVRRPGPESPGTRREISTLRMLRIPGVVRLFDEGEEDGHTFFVMERVDGSPFPGPPAGLDRARPPDTSLAGGAPAPTETLSSIATAATGSAAVTVSAGGRPRWRWEALAGVTEALLEALQRVHSAGIVHRDLKPSNILVQPDGRPVLLDFGLCLPTTEGAQRRVKGSGIEGTPAYLAPEQIRGGPIDARADLYAVGVILYELLTGCLPHDASTPAALLRIRATRPAVPVRDRVAAIPEGVAEVVDRLLMTSPADRPQSAGEVLAALRSLRAAGQALAADPGETAGRRLLHSPDGGPFREDTLRPLFSGRQRLFHLPEDAARALLSRTGGDRARVHDEVDAWIRAGVARPDGDRLRVDRDALDRFDLGFPIAAPSAGSAPEPPPASGAPGRFFALVAAGRDGEAAEEALSAARGLAERGRHGLAAAMLGEGLSAARRAPSSAFDLEPALLAEWVKVALAEQSSHAIDRVLYEVCRARRRASPEVASLESLLRAALSVRTYFSSEPAALAESIGVLDDPSLERWRHWVRIRAWVFVDMSLAERALSDAERWAEAAGDSVAAAAAAGFRGLVLFVQGRFPEAARWHAAAARGERWLTLKIAQMLNEAVALVEAFDPARAGEVAGRAARLAAECRHPHFEGRAEWAARDASYRTGRPMTPDLDLLESLSDLGSADTLGPACLTEAAVAFRLGDRALAARLAARAADTWQRAGHRHPALLARALAAAMGGGLNRDEAEEMAALAVKCPVPGIGMQALGLLRWASPDLAPPPPDAIAALAAQVPADRWSARLDVLSIDEARGALLGPSVAPAAAP